MSKSCSHLAFYHNIFFEHASRLQDLLKFERLPHLADQAVAAVLEEGDMCQR